MRIDELRSTLHQHADGLHDEGLVDRAAAVHHRVRVVRRRRTATVAGLAAVVVAGAALAVLPQRDTSPEPANTPRTVLGQAVPQTLVADGYEYHPTVTAVSAVGADSLRLNLKVGSTPRLVAFTSTRAGGLLRLTDSTEGQVAGSASGALTTYLQVQAGPRDKLTLRDVGGSDAGRLAVVVYDAAPDFRPDGVGGYGFWFRQHRPEAELVEGRVTAPGTRTLALEVPRPAGSYQVHDLCSSAARGVQYRLHLDGQSGGPWNDCQDEPQPLPAGGNFATYPTVKDDPANVTLQLEARAKPGSGADLSEVVLGAAVYRVLTPAARVAGWNLAERISTGGRIFAYEGVVEGATGQVPVTTRLPASDVDRTVSVASMDVQGTVDVLVDGRAVTGFTGSGRGSGMLTTDVVLPAGGPHTVTTRLNASESGAAPDNSRARVAIATYRLGG